MSPLPTNHNVIGEINNIFFNFLWDRKGDKLKRDIVISNYENGGLKMLNIKHFKDLSSLTVMICSQIIFSWAMKVAITAEGFV